MNIFIYFEDFKFVFVSYIKTYKTILERAKAHK